MSNRKSLVLIAVIVLVAAVLILGGGRWLWNQLLAMHGMHN